MTSDGHGHEESSRAPAQGEKCIFCAIVKKQVPSFKVYEDSDFLAILDIRPLNKGHTLVIPKKHYQWTYEVDAFGPYWEFAKKIALAQISGLEAKYVQFLTAGLGVHHAHIHVVPRFDDDGHGENLDHTNIKQMTEPELKEVAEKLTSAVHAIHPPKIEIPVKEKKQWTEEELFSMKRDSEQT